MFHVGDKVKCISNPYNGEPFTIGKIYEVIEFENYGDTREWNSIRDDKNCLRTVNHIIVAPYFELCGVESKISQEIAIKTKATKECVEPWASILQNGCQCGAIKPYKQEWN